MEAWKPVAGFENYYEVSDRGRVRSKNRVQLRFNGKMYCPFHISGKVLKPYRTGKNDGYPTVNLIAEGVSVNKKVHRLVAEAFIPNENGYDQINHKDGNKDNNAVDNLEWIDGYGNINHGFDTGLFPLGEDKCNAKLTAEEVREIRKIYKKGSKEYGAKPLSRKYGVSSTTIRHIVNGRKWRRA